MPKKPTDPKAKDSLKEATALMKKHELEPPHALQVARLACRLFELTAPLHREGPRSLTLLHTAALLHDIGWSRTPTGKRHHKLSAEMILEHSWKFFSRHEVRLVALISRYHRKKPPCEKHEQFSSLSARARLTVRKLAAILRVADALDRSHRQMVVIEDFAQGSSEEGKPSVLKISSKRPVEEELYGVNKKKDLFEEVLGTELELELKP